MNKILTFCLVLFCNISAIVSACHAAENLAKGKPYTVSPTQNYQLSAAPSNTTALTDGIYTDGNFWTQKTTVGWQRAKIVEILIDLEHESNIDKVSFSSARGKHAEVYYPEHIATFVGSDREHLTYVGDLADDPANLPGPYQAKKFILSNIGMRGRFVLLEAIPKGPFLFCDEVEVMEGKAEQRKPGSLTVEAAHGFADQLILQTRERELLSKMADNFSTLVDSQTGKSKLREIILELKTASNADAIESELLALRGKELVKKTPGKVLDINSINPWAPLDPISRVSDTTGTSLSLVIPQNGYDSGAALITNLSTHSMPITVALEKMPSGFDLFLYQVPFVKTAAMEKVADPLVPVTTAIILRPGESRMLFVTAFGKHPGNWNTTLSINGDGNVTKLPITIQVARVALPKKLSLNAVNWGYLDFKLIRDRQQAAVADLLAHHTDVVVVPPSYLPNADPAKALDFSRLESYLKLNRGADKVLLFMNLRSDSRLTLGGSYPFLGEKWKIAVKRWYEEAKQTAIRAGFKADQLYWYPFDEMNGKEIDQFIALSKWARSEIAGVRLYATLGSKDSERALPFVDIAQIAGDDNTLARFAAGNAEKWLYDTKGTAKSLSPYSYYRLMAWKAFFEGFKGIGFWAYADAGWGDTPGTAWDDFDGKYPDFSVVYEGDDMSIISSRRWEGWRMGIEDYELLTMYAKVKGEATAKALAKEVVSDPSNVSVADEARRRILRELSR